jgi:hypothetical protein
MAPQEDSNQVGRESAHKRTPENPHVVTSVTSSASQSTCIVALDRRAQNHRLSLDPCAPVPFGESAKGLDAVHFGMQPLRHYFAA